MKIIAIKSLANLTTGTLFINKLEEKQRLEISSKLELYRENPYANTQLDIKFMQGYESLYRLRLGQYRFIY